MDQLHARPADIGQSDEFQVRALVAGFESCDPDHDILRSRCLDNASGGCCESGGALDSPSWESSSWLLAHGISAAQAPFYLVVETQGSNAEHDGAKLEAFLEDALGTGIVADGTLAQDSSQAAAIWGLRESISEGLRHAGARSC